MRSASPEKLSSMTSPAIVSTSDLHRTYGEGEAAVHALQGVSVDSDSRSSA